MNSTDKILDTKYSLNELGRRTSLYRIKHKLTQAGLAEAIFDSMKEKGLVDPDAEFKAEVGRVTISKLEKGNRCPARDFVYELIGMIEDDSNSNDDPEIIEHQYDQIIRDLTIIVRNLPLRSAESLLLTARMIRDGSFNNIDSRGY